MGGCATPGEPSRWVGEWLLCSCSPLRPRTNIKVDLEFTCHGQYRRETDESSFDRSECPSFQIRLQALIHPLLDGGSSGLLALYTIEEILSRLAFDLKSKDELMAWSHFKMMIGTGPGG